MNTLGIDIGGTKIYVARYNEQLKMEAETIVPTEANKTKKHTLSNLLKAINTVRNTETTSIGVAWAGFVDVKKGQIIKAPNVPHLDGFNLCSYIKDQTGLKTIIENDARAFAYGSRAELAPNSKMCLCIIIGTGVGSGLIYNGSLIYGAHGFVGEIGHITRQNKELEAWLAGPDLKTFLSLPVDIQFSSILPAQKKVLLQKLATPLDVFTDWLSGLVLTFDPDQIILGGGTARYFWQHFETEIMQATQAKLKGYPNTFKLSFYNGNNAGATGVAALSTI